MKKKPRKRTPPPRRKPPASARSGAEMANGIHLHQKGQLDGAEAIYRGLLDRTPRHVDALHFLGVLLHQRGSSSEAIACIQQALSQNPNYVDALNNLGNIFKEGERYPEAEAAYRRVIALEPRHAAAFNNLGAVLRAERRVDEAVSAYQKALELQPKSADTWHNFGNALRDARRIADAINAYGKALELEPRHVETFISYGRLLYAQGRADEAAAVYRRWLEVDPVHPIASHMLVACEGATTPARASDEFVRATFDRFADSFDEVLTRLDYRAPELILTALREQIPRPAGQLDVLDAGCGTGLCGAGLRPFARQLVGVDLSSGMLRKADGLSVYDDLHEAELTAYLVGQQAAWDVIVSADTLVYFGQLDQVVEAAAQALRPNGLLLFSLENLSEDETNRGYRLNPHGRFSHTRRYVEQVVERSGLSRSKLDEQTLRREAGKSVPGWIVTARKELQP